MTKKMSGSIFAVGRNNKLCVQVGRKRVYTGLIDNQANRKIAQQIQLKLYLEMHGIADKSKNVILIKNAFAEFIDVYCSRHELSTVDLYRHSYRSIIKKPNHAISANSIENEVISFIRRFDGSDATINIYLRSLQVFINYCVRRKYITPLTAYKDYKRPTTEKEIKIFTDVELEQLIGYFDKADSEFALLLILLVQTGMRIGEALKLEKSQIQNDRILIPNKINKNKSEIVYIKESLRQKLMDNCTDRTNVFRWKYSTYSRLVKRFNTALEQLDLKKRTFHDLRRTYLRRLIDAGTPVEVAQKLMRHKNIHVTIKFYT